MARQVSYKVQHGNITFDSQTEYFYYLTLLEDKDKLGIENIICHPTFEIVPAYIVQCINHCDFGKVPSPKTDKMINCKKCKGKGFMERSASYYTPDFQIEYKDGRTEYIDVKGGLIQGSFYLRKTLFEARYGQHLFIVKWDKIKGWVKK